MEQSFEIEEPNFDKSQTNFNKKIFKWYDDSDTDEYDESPIKNKIENYQRFNNHSFPNSNSFLNSFSRQENFFPQSIRPSKTNSNKTNKFLNQSSKNNNENNSPYFASNSFGFDDMNDLDEGLKIPKPFSFIDSQTKSSTKENSVIQNSLKTDTNRVLKSVDEIRKNKAYLLIPQQCLIF